MYMNKLLEITKSWLTAINPSEEQMALATERLATCSACEHAMEVDVKNMTGGIVDNYFTCGKCGCPLRGKVFTPIENGCPENKWKK